MRHRRTAAILALCAAIAAPLPAAALEGGRVSGSPSVTAQAERPSPLAVLMWRWNVHRLLASATTPVALRVPEPSQRELRITSRIEPRIRARLAALSGRTPGRTGRPTSTREIRTAGVDPNGSVPKRPDTTPRLDLPPFLAAAASPAGSGFAVEVPQQANGDASGLLYAAAALAHGRIETGDETWKLGVSVSRDLDEFKLRLGYRFPAR